MADQVRLMQAIDEAHWRLKRGEYDEAVRLASEARELAPDHPPAMHVHALALAESEQYVESQAVLEQLSDVVGDSSALHIARAQTLAELGEYETARQQFDAVLTGWRSAEPDRQRGAALTGRALVRAGLGDYAGADDDFSAAIVLCPAAAQLYYDQGRVWHQQGEPHKAAWCFRLALQVDQPALGARRRERAQAYVKRVSQAQ